MINEHIDTLSLYDSRWQEWLELMSQQFSLYDNILLSCRPVVCCNNDEASSYSFEFELALQTILYLYLLVHVAIVESYNTSRMTSVVTEITEQQSKFVVIFLLNELSRHIWLRFVL